jgi:glucose uptake protein GlcU
MRIKGTENLEKKWKFPLGHENYSLSFSLSQMNGLIIAGFKFLFLLQKKKKKKKTWEEYLQVTFIFRTI